MKLKVDIINDIITINGKSNEWMIGDDGDPILDCLKKGELKAAIKRIDKISKIRKSFGEITQPNQLDQFKVFLNTI